MLIKFLAKRSFPEYVLIFLTLAFYLIFLIHKIDLTTVDLGRHIRNGEFILKDKDVLFTNFYSFSNPTFSTINHHWASGVIFYEIWKFCGFLGLQLFFILVSLVTFFVTYRIGIAKIGIYLSSLLALLIIPLLAERTEIRPEMFSYFLAVIFYYFLTYGSKGKDKKLFLLPVLQLLWVNLHVYFFLGPFLIFVFILEKLISKKWKKALNLVWIFLTTLLVCLVNPSFVSGAIQPLLIFKEYGYRVLENQPLLFIEKLIFTPNFIIFKIVFGLLVLSIIVRLAKRKEVNVFTDIILLLFFSVLGFLAIRNFYLFGMFGYIILTNNIAVIWPDLPLRLTERLRTMALIIVTSSLILIPLINFQTKFSGWSGWGLGLIEGNSRAANFFIKNKLKGPLFNNYDIGGYLIFYLFPKERVFVDNRPEAYPVNFFQKEYIPMQEKELNWQEKLKKYKFNTTFFSMTDKTTWAQTFLINRIKDKEWVPVYADKYAIIFLRNNGENKNLISRFRLPENYFKITGI